MWRDCPLLPAVWYHSPWVLLASECRKFWGFGPVWALEDRGDSEPLGSAPAAREACSWWDSTLHGASAPCYSLPFIAVAEGNRSMAAFLSKNNQWQKWSGIYLSCRRALPKPGQGADAGSPQFSSIAGWAEVAVHLIDLSSLWRTQAYVEALDFALKFLRLFCGILNTHFYLQTGRIDGRVK